MIKLYLCEDDTQQRNHLKKSNRKYDPRGFIVFVTTHSEMSYMTFMYKLEALDFILKDDREEMTRRVHECILRANEIWRYMRKYPEIRKIRKHNISNGGHFCDHHCFCFKILL